MPLNRISDEMRVKRRIRLFETTDWDKAEQDVLRATSAPEMLQTEKGTSHSKLLPVLEEICRNGTATISDEELKAAHLHAVGWVEIDLILHRGIAPEHRSCTAGDSEMRYAFDTYMTLQDAGERARPRSLATEQLRQASKASKLTVGTAASNTAEAGTDAGSISAPRSHRRVLSNTSARVSQTSQVTLAKTPPTQRETRMKIHCMQTLSPKPSLIA